MKIQVCNWSLNPEFVNQGNKVLLSLLLLLLFVVTSIATKNVEKFVASFLKSTHTKRMPAFKNNFFLRIDFEITFKHTHAEKTVSPVHNKKPALQTCGLTSWKTRIHETSFARSVFP